MVNEPEHNPYTEAYEIRSGSYGDMMGGATAGLISGLPSYNQLQISAEELKNAFLYQNDYSSLVTQSYLGLQPKNEPIKMETNMITEVATDMKKFIREHKSTIYWIMMLLIIDHFFFHGAFKDKLKASMEKFVGKVETKIHEIKA